MSVLFSRETYFEHQRLIIQFLRNSRTQKSQLYMQIIIDILLHTPSFGLLIIHILLAQEIGQLLFLQKIESISILGSILAH